MIFRFLRIIAGGVLLLLLLSTFFLAVVFHFPHWLYHYLSPELTGKIVRHCALTRLAMPSRDTDGDGGPDWYEDWTGRDPKASADSPLHTLRRYGCSDCIYAGERTRMRVYPQIDSLSYRWRPGLSLKLSAAGAILLPPGGEGEIPSDELDVTVDAQGFLQFDVVLQPMPSGKFPSFISVAIPSSDSTVPSRTEHIDIRGYGWRAERLPVRLEYDAEPLPTRTLSGPNPRERGFLHYLTLPSKSHFPGLQSLFATEAAGFGWSGAPPVPRFYLVFAPRIWVPYGWTLILPWPTVIHYPAPTPPFHHIIEIARADQPETWLPMFPIDSEFENTDEFGNPLQARIAIKEDFDYGVDPSLFPGYDTFHHLCIYRIVPVYGLPQYYNPAKMGGPIPASR